MPSVSRQAFAAFSLHRDARTRNRRRGTSPRERAVQRRPPRPVESMARPLTAAIAVAVAIATAVGVAGITAVAIAISLAAAPTALTPAVSLRPRRRRIITA